MSDDQLRAARVGALLSSLGMEEIARLLAGADAWHTFSVPEKGVKALRFSDGPNGVRGVRTFNGSRTAGFPCPVAQAATWNPNLLYLLGSEMANQAKAKGVSVLLAPTVNIHRSPLGGRSFESFSEDPVLSGKLGASLVRGLQDHGIGACVKHFVCNDQETDRMKVDAVVDQRTMREIYLKPFQVIIRESQPWAIMAAYNRVNGIHCSENKALLEDILRKEWGWSGLMMSDWFGVSSSAESLNAGLDLEMPGRSIWRSPEQLLRIIGAGKVALPTLLARAANILTLVDKVSGAGLKERALEREDNNPRSREVNRKVAQEAIVLLQNKSGLLPLKRPGSVVVIGPNAKRDLSTGGGSANLRKYYYISAYDGIETAMRKVSPQTKLSFSQGCFAHEMLPLLTTTAKTGEDGFHLEFFAGDFDNPRGIQASLSTDSAQMVFFDSLPKEVTLPAHARITSTFSPTEDAIYEFSLITTGRARLYVDGNLVVSSWDKQEPSSKFFGLAAKEMKGSVALKKGVAYKILVEYSTISSIPERKGNPLGGGIIRIGAHPIFDPYQLMDHAVSAASMADVVILCLGTDQERESEGYDRSGMKLVGRQNELAERVLDVNPKTVVLNFSGTPVEMPWAGKASAIIQAWFLGSELGNAVGDMIFGRCTPSGKLPISFPFRLEDNPSHGHFPGENSVVTYKEGLNIGYRYYTTKNVPVAFPFGHGLSYTSFTYQNLRSSSWTLECDGKISISVEIANTGSRQGSEVAQLYISHLDATVTRPTRELQSFAKVTNINPGESKTALFVIDKYAISYYDVNESAWMFAKGMYNVQIGSSSEKIILEHKLEVKKTVKWYGI